MLLPMLITVWCLLLFPGLLDWDQTEDLSLTVLTLFFVNTLHSPFPAECSNLTGLEV